MAIRSRLHDSISKWKNNSNLKNALWLVKTIHVSFNLVVYRIEQQISLFKKFVLRDWLLMKIVLKVNFNVKLYFDSVSVYELHTILI